MSKGKEPKENSKKIREKALKQLRETRAKINADHPDLLASVKKTIERVKNAPAAPKPVIEQSTKEIKINREKNLKAVMKFLALSRQSDSFESKLKKMLMDTEKGARH